MAKAKSSEISTDTTWIQKLKPLSEEERKRLFPNVPPPRLDELLQMKKDKFKDKIPHK